MIVDNPRSPSATTSTVVHRVREYGDRRSVCTVQRPFRVTTDPSLVTCRCCIKRSLVLRG